MNSALRPYTWNPRQAVGDMGILASRGGKTARKDGDGMLLQMAKWEAIFFTIAAHSAISAKQGLDLDFGLKSQELVPT